MSDDHGSLAEEAARLAEALDGWVRASVPQLRDQLSAAAGALLGALAAARGPEGQAPSRPPVQPIPVD